MTRATSVRPCLMAFGDNETGLSLLATVEHQSLGNGRCGCWGG